MTLEPMVLQMAMSAWAVFLISTMEAISSGIPVPHDKMVMPATVSGMPSCWPSRWTTQTET